MSSHATPSLSDPSLFRQQCYVGGQWVDADDGSTVEVNNPANGEILGTVPRFGAAETRRDIEVANEAWPAWRAMTAKQRADILRNWFNLMMENQDDLGVLMTLEQGKERVDMERLADNLENVFIWRGIFPDWGSEAGLEDDIALTGDWSQAKRLGGVQGVVPAFPERPEQEFYRGPTIDHLIQNYAVAWSRYAIELDRGLEVERNPEKAIEAMQRAWLVNPDFGPAVNFLGYLYMKAGAMDEALMAYEHFARTNPPDFRFWARYAQALESAGRHEQVIDALGHVIDLNEDYEPALVSLVDYIMVYFPTRQNIAAVRSHLVRFLERHPESPLIRSRLEQLDELIAGAASPEGERP